MSVMLYAMINTQTEQIVFMQDYLVASAVPRWRPPEADDEDACSRAPTTGGGSTSATPPLPSPLTAPSPSSPPSPPSAATCQGNQRLQCVEAAHEHGGLPLGLVALGFVVGIFAGRWTANAGVGRSKVGVVDTTGISEGSTSANPTFGDHT